MNHSRLPADLEELVERELAAGEYRAEAEPLADAVRLLRECHKSHKGRPETARCMCLFGRSFKKPSKTSMRRK